MSVRTSRGDLLLAHDLGTSGNKATLYSESGEMVGSEVCSYPTQYSHGSWAEQDANDWWNAVVVSTRTLLADIDPARIAAVSFSGHMNGCLPVDGAGNPLRNAILWADVRAVPQTEQLINSFTQEGFYALTGHRASPAYSIEKLMWIRDNQPEIYAKTYKMLQSKDYVALRLTGNFATDHSDASNTNAYDLKKRAWSDEILRTAGISRDKMPEILPSTAVTGTVSREAAALTGLLAGTPVVAGGGDGCCATVGTGCVSDGMLYGCLGTSGWLSASRERPIMDPEMRVFNLVHVVPGQYIPCGAMQSAGAAYNWMKQEICRIEAYFHEQGGNHENIYSSIDRQILQSPPGANGILFLPYLLGERSPWWDSRAKGAFIGIKPETKREDLLRSVVEGVALNMMLIRDVFAEHIETDRITLVGGLAKSPVWRRILSDALGLAIAKPYHIEEATSMGAAVTAGVGVGLYDDFSAIVRFLQIEEEIDYNPDAHAVYRKLLPVYKQSYLALRETFSALTELSESDTSKGI